MQRARMGAQVWRKEPNLLLCHQFGNGKPMGLGPLFNCFGHVRQQKKKKKGATPINPLDGAVSCPAPVPPGGAPMQGKRWAEERHTGWEPPANNGYQIRTPALLHRDHPPPQHQ